jgi:Asp-tRNA(Asn)/Glu-tRNA(Gln) amidotransferase A subunit family amidase
MTEPKNELIRHSAAELAAKLAAREVTAVEVTQAHLDRIAPSMAEPRRQRVPARQQRGSFGRRRRG